MDTIYVAMASRTYGEGRILIHTDRIGGFQTGHGDNTRDFWRRILEWVSNKTAQENIKLALVINTQPSASDKIHSMKPINVDKLSINDLVNANLSNYDCIYMVGLPVAVSSNVAQKISDYVERGGGLAIEYPNRGNEYINVLSDIESVYCYSSARPLLTNAYWTIDGGNSYIYNDNAQISFMSTLRQADFSSNWTMLMTNIISTVTTTTTTLLSTASTLIFDKTGSSSFSMSYTGAMQKGVVFLEL